MKQKPTPNQGAAIRSAVIKAKLKREMRKHCRDFRVRRVLIELYHWVGECDERASKRKGGLGRK